MTAGEAIRRLRELPADAEFYVEVRDLPDGRTVMVPVDQIRWDPNR